MQHVSHALFRLLCLTVLFTLACPACRSPEKEEEWKPPDVPEFDASTDGDTDTDADTDGDTDTDSDGDTDTDADPTSDASVDGSPDTTQDGGVLDCPSSKVNNNHSPYFGGDDSVDVVVNVFASFRCGHCANFAKNSKELWGKRPDFRKRVRLYYHHYPLFENNENVWEQHRAAVAAHNQGMEHFWTMHDFIYEGMLADPVKYYSKQELIDYARDTMKLDMTKFSADFEADKTYSFLLWDEKQGKDVGVTGTPAIFVCEEKVVWSKLESTIDRYLGN